MAARASRIATTIGAIAIATLLASCATTAEVDEETVGASATPMPSASPEPTPEPTTFTTQNGTASFELPAGWTVEDTSELQPHSNYGGPIWANSVTLLDADGVARATYADGYGDDVGAAVDRGVVQSIAMAHDLHAAAWWTTTLDGTSWTAAATVVQDMGSPGTSVMPEGYARLHSFSAALSEVPECASVVDEASAIACLESPGTTQALELLATLELEPLPWDAMPEGVDPQADAPWVDFVSDDGAVAFSYPASWSIMTHSPTAGSHGDTFVTLVTPDGYQALDIRRTAQAPPPSQCAGAPASPAWVAVDVLSGEPVTPVVDAAIDPGSPLQLATFVFGGDGSDGTIGVAVLRAEHVAAGCFDPWLSAGTGSIEVTTPHATDAQGLIYDLYPGGVGFVGSYEHDVMLEVSRSVAVNF